jgi:uracil-DNA glycosylase
MHPFFTKVAARASQQKSKSTAPPSSQKNKENTRTSPPAPPADDKFADKRAAAMAKLRAKRAASAASSGASASSPASTLGKRKDAPSALSLRDAFPAPAASASSGGWLAALEPQFQKGYFKRLESFLDAQYRAKTVYPPRHQIFEAFRLCPLDKVRVVIIGQDPYHGPGQGHGVCFSVQRGVRVPPSLRNIFKELHADTGDKIPTHGNLEAWARQGVLLLNTVLTVVRGQANSHRKRGWEDFTDAVIRHLARETQGVVFLCWGNPAQKKAQLVSRSRHHVLTSSHPSPLGATKTAHPFIGSRCFSKVNEILRKQGKAEIDWGL